MRITLRAFADAPLGTVFETLADIPNWPSFMARIADVELLTGGPLGIGTRFAATRRLLGRAAVEELTVADYDPPRGLALTAQERGVHYQLVYALKHTGSETAIALDFTGEPVTVVARMLQPVAILLAPSLRRELEADLADLVTESERRAGRAPAPVFE